MRKLIPTCDCQSQDFVQIKTVYNIQYDDHVCPHCEHYPVYIPESDMKPETNWRAEFSQDLKELLEKHGDVDEVDEDFQYIERQLRKQA